MDRKNKPPSSLSEAIAQLESLGQSASNDFRERFAADFEQVKVTLEQIKPHLDDLRSTFENKGQEAKTEVENQVKQNPWFVLGIIGLLAFFIGWLLGHKKRQ